MEDHNSCDIRIDDLTDELTEARATIDALAKALDRARLVFVLESLNMDWKDADAVLETHARVIQLARGY